MKLSAVIIAKNVEDQIADAISSVDFADEVIVIDNNSSDRTAEIAKHLKAEVLICNSSDFSDLRNFGLEKAQGEWVLYIDADERVTDTLRESIRSGIRNPFDLVQGSPREFTPRGGQESGIIAYRIKRKNYYLGNHEWPYIEKLERLFKKSSLKRWYGRLHESPVIDGKVGELDGFLLHYSHRDLTSMLNKTIEWSRIEAELRLNANHPKMTWWRFSRVMISAFLDSYIKQGGWKVGTVGLVESVYQSFSMFITYAKLWEMQHEKERI